MGKWTQAAQRVREAMDVAGARLDDAAALDAMAIYPAWGADTAYAIGQRLRYGDKLYTCAQAHTSQGDWIPSDTPALWVRVSIE